MIGEVRTTEPSVNEIDELIVSIKLAEEMAWSLRRILIKNSEEEARQAAIQLLSDALARLRLA